MLPPNAGFAQKASNQADVFQNSLYWGPLENWHAVC